MTENADLLLPVGTELTKLFDSLFAQHRRDGFTYNTEDGHVSDCGPNKFAYVPNGYDLIDDKVFDHRRLLSYHSLNTIAQGHLGFRLFFPSSYPGITLCQYQEYRMIVTRVGNICILNDGRWFPEISSDTLSRSPFRVNRVTRTYYAGDELAKRQLYSFFGNGLAPFVAGRNEVLLLGYGEYSDPTEYPTDDEGIKKIPSPYYQRNMIDADLKPDPYRTIIAYDWNRSAGMLTPLAFLNSANEYFGRLRWQHVTNEPICVGRADSASMDSIQPHPVSERDMLMVALHPGIVWRAHREESFIYSSNPNLPPHNFTVPALASDGEPRIEILGGTNSGEYHFGYNEKVYEYQDMLYGLWLLQRELR